MTNLNGRRPYKLQCTTHRLDGMLKHVSMSAMGLGRVKTPFPWKSVRSQEPRLCQAAIAAISGLVPTMFMTRVRL
jgi:hypothetical protein